MTVEAGDTMARITFIEHSGTEHVIEAEVGQSVMQAATSAHKKSQENRVVRALARGSKSFNL